MTRPTIDIHAHILDPEAIRLMQRERFYGLKYRGTTYDCGDKVGFLAANVAFALDRADVGPGFRDALKKILAERGGL